MNPANFQGMTAQGMVPQGHQGVSQQGGQQRGGIPPQAVQQNIFRMLSTQQSQQNLQGWQASVSIQQRVYVIYQLSVVLLCDFPATFTDSTQGFTIAAHQSGDER